MRKLTILLTFVLLGGCGCDEIQPLAEQSKTEKKKLVELVKQTEALERIAVAIESRGHTGH